MVDGRGGLRNAGLADQLQHALQAAPDVADTTQPACQREALALVRLIDDVELEVVRRLTRSHAAGITELSGALTLEQLLTTNTDLSPARAKVLGRVVEWATRFESTAAALFTGHVSIAQVDAIARHAFALTSEYLNEQNDILDMAARAEDLDRLEMQLRAWRDHHRPADAAERDRREFEQRSIRLQPQLFGGGDIRGHLPAGEFETVAAALETEPDPANGPVDPRTLGQRQADQLVDVCAAWLGLPTGEDSTNSDSPSESSEPDGRNRRPVSIDVVLDIQSLLGTDHPDYADVRRELRYGRMVSDQVVDQLLCDASYRRLVFDGPNRVINTGTSTPDIPRPLRRAIQRRDRHCQFAGCKRHWSDCDVHHIVWRRNGGLTDEQNLCLLCPRHHTLVHRAGYHLGRDPTSEEILTWLPDLDGDEWALDAEGKWTKATGPIEPSWANPRRPNGRPHEPPD